MAEAEGTETNIVYVSKIHPCPNCEGHECGEWHVHFNTGMIFRAPLWAIESIRVHIGAAFRVDPAGNLFRDSKLDVATLTLQ